MPTLTLTEARARGLIQLPPECPRGTRDCADCCACCHAEARLDGERLCGTCLTEFAMDQAELAREDCRAGLCSHRQCWGES